MARLTRAEQQERTRASVLAAARQEFSERGYAEARVDEIAERAELTRGAVYSNFPSKRALYLAVLVDSVERADGTQPGADEQPGSAAELAGAFARGWLERLPLAGDASGDGKLSLRSLTGVLDDEPARLAMTQVVALEALLLGMALERRDPGTRPGEVRRVRLAQLMLTLLNGSGSLAETAPGLGDPFDVALACEHLAGLDLLDTWDPPHVPFVGPAERAAEPWSGPARAVDRLTGSPVEVAADGVVAVLGAHRLAAAEEAVRAARAGEQVVIVVTTSNPAETGRLIRLRVGDLAGCVRRVAGSDPWSPVRLVIDQESAVQSALGIREPSDDVETAVRIRAGTVVARADGRGAGYAASTYVGQMSK